MEKLSKQLGKPVINIFEGRLEGYVKNILVDKKLQKVLWLEIFDDENQEEKLIGAKSVYSTTEDAIMLKNGESIFLADTIIKNEINPIGYAVYMASGKYVDKVLDIDFDSKYNVNNIYLKNQNVLDKKTILLIGENIIVQKDNKYTKLSYFAPKKVNAENQPNTIVKSLDNNQNKQIIVPKKVLTTSYEFLIGRKVGQNLYAENGQLIAKKQSKITNQIIDNASQNGKLKELTSYSLT